MKSSWKPSKIKRTFSSKITYLFLAEKMIRRKESLSSMDHTGENFLSMVTRQERREDRREKRRQPDTRTNRRKNRVSSLGFPFGFQIYL